MVREYIKLDFDFSLSRQLQQHQPTPYPIVIFASLLCFSTTLQQQQLNSLPLK